MQEHTQRANRGYSLNAGRYVGVVIEEDGKTEEEFIEELLQLNLEIRKLTNQAATIDAVVLQNIQKITGES